MDVKLAVRAASALATPLGAVPTDLHIGTTKQHTGRPTHGSCNVH